MSRVQAASRKGSVSTNTFVYADVHHASSSSQYFGNVRPIENSTTNDSPQSEDSDKENTTSERHSETTLFKLLIVHRSGLGSILFSQDSL